MALPYKIRNVYDSLNEKSQLADQPKKIKIEMKQNQLAILHAAINIENRNIKLPNGDIFDSEIIIIGDKVGSGKSLSSLSIIANNKDAKPKTQIKSFGKFSHLLVENKLKYFSINIFVVPHGVFPQWQNYILTDTNLLAYFVGSSKDIKNNLDLSSYEYFDLILVKSSFYNNFISSLNADNACISRIFFDECTSINISSCKNIKANQYYLISSSLEEVSSAKINHVGMIRELLESVKLMSDFYDIIILKNSDEFIEKSFKIPNPKRFKLICKSPTAINILNGIVDNDIIQMLNGGDINGILLKYEITQSDDINVINIICSDYYDKLKNMKIDRHAIESKTYKSPDGKKNALENIDKKINEIESKINMIKDRIQDSNECGICLSEFNNKTLTPCCNNAFCFECITLSLNNKNTCPFCNQIISNIKKLIVIGSGDNNLKFEKDENELQDKPAEFEKLLQKINNKDLRLLIFSNYDASFEQLLSILKKYNIKYNNIKGTADHINLLVNEYKKGTVQCLLLNAKYYGSGLNLENTTHIVKYHKMSSDLDKQIEGRAQRPGRTCELEIYDLVYENEEK